MSNNEEKQYILVVKYSQGSWDDFCVHDIFATTDEEKAKRTDQIQAATKNAIEIPFKVMQTAAAAMPIVQAMATIGNPNSVSDAGVAALCIRSAVMGAFMNVRINAGSYNDKNYVTEIIAKGKAIEDSICEQEIEILKVVNDKIGL